MRFSRKLFRRSFFDRLMNISRLKKHTPLRVKLLTTFAIISLLMSGLTFAVGGVGAAITWPSTPAGEASGGTIMSYLQNAFGDATTQTEKVCTSSGVIRGFKIDGTPICATLSELSGGASASTTPPTTTTLPPTTTTTSTSLSFTFSGSSTSITSGASATLTWSTTNATSCTASNGWSGSKATGSNKTEIVSPTSNTTYRLTCTGSDGTSLSQEVTVTVNQPPSLTFQANNGSSASVNYNGSVTLSWNTNNVTSCTATNFTLPSNYLTTNKSITLSNLTANTTYTLSCTGSGGSTSQSVTVNVANPVAPSVMLSISNTLVYNNTNVTLSWTLSNVTSCTANFNLPNDYKTNTSVSVVPNSNTTTTYRLNCGGAQSQVVSVQTYPLPISSCFTYTKYTSYIQIDGYNWNSNGCLGSNFIDILEIPSLIDGLPVTTIGTNAFYDKKIRSVIIPSSITTIRRGAFAYNFLTSLTIPDSVTSIGNEAFLHNQITSINLGKNLTSIGSFAFKQNLLTTLIIPDSVTSIGQGAFIGTRSTFTADYSNRIESVIIGNGLNNIGDEVFSKNRLTSLVIPNSVTSIGNEAFDGNDITSLVIPNSVTSIGNEAFDGNDITSLVIPNSVTSIGNNAFQTNQLTSLTIPDSVTSIGARAFRYNTLTSVTIGNGVINIGEEAFAGMSIPGVPRNVITSVTIGNSVTSIGEKAFIDNQLTSLVIPNSVTSIGRYAFSGNRFTSLVIPNSVTSIGRGAFVSQTSSLGNGTVYGPSFGYVKDRYMNNQDNGINDAIFDKSKLPNYVNQ